MNQQNLCLSVKDVNQPLIKAFCSPVDELDSSQLFKWLFFSDQLFHPASNLCVEGSAGRWGNVYSFLLYNEVVKLPKTFFLIKKR